MDVSYNLMQYLRVCIHITYYTRLLYSVVVQRHGSDGLKLEKKMQFIEFRLFFKPEIYLKLSEIFRNNRATSNFYIALISLY